MFFKSVKTKNTQPNNSRGFSLVELLVSVSIFAVIITMTVGTLLVLIDANAKAQNMEEVMTNLSFALDHMTREIRTGRSYYCAGTDEVSGLSDFDTQDCSNGGVYLSLVEGGESITGSDTRLDFRFNQNQGTIDRRVGEGSWFPLTSTAVTITDATFYVSDTDTAADGDATQANVTIFISGHVGALATVDTSFALQTSITKRILDI